MNRQSWHFPAFREGTIGPDRQAQPGAPEVVDQLKKSYKAIGRTYKNLIDGFTFLLCLTG